MLGRRTGTVGTAIYGRIIANGEFKEWVPINAPLIANSTDLNNYQTSGFYSFGSANITNGPGQNIQGLLLYVYSADNFISQILFGRNTTGGYMTCHYRSGSSLTGQAWHTFDFSGGGAGGVTLSTEQVTVPDNARQ